MTGVWWITGAAYVEQQLGSWAQQAKAPDGFQADREADGHGEVKRVGYTRGIFESDHRHPAGAAPPAQGMGEQWVQRFEDRGHHAASASGTRPSSTVPGSRLAAARIEDTAGQGDIPEGLKRAGQISAPTASTLVGFDEGSMGRSGRAASHKRDVAALAASPVSAG